MWSHHFLRTLPVQVQDDSDDGGAVGPGQNRINIWNGAGDETQVTALA